MRTERAPSPSDPRDKGTDERTRTKDTTLTRGGTGSEIIGSGITTGSKAPKQTIFLARGQRRREGAKGTEEGRTAVEGDRKGGVVVIGSKEDTY